MRSMQSRRQVEFGVLLLLISLSVFFAAALLAVLLVSRRLPNPQPLPVSLWVATAFLLASSVLLHAAGRAVRRERQRPLRTWMLSASLASLCFFAAQAQGLWELSQRHLQAGGASQAWILLSLLVVLHSAHVLVGLLLLGLVTVRAARGRLDHECHFELTLLTRYWDFLDAVWLVILAGGWMLLR